MLPLLRRLVAVALLALWLPATAHCSLEAAGLDEVFGCASGHHEPGQDRGHAADGCDVVESGLFRSISGQVALPPPALSACLFAFVVPAELPLDPPREGLAGAHTAPPDVARTWQFVVRAVRLARAPNTLS